MSQLSSNSESGHIIVCGSNALSDAVAETLVHLNRDVVVIAADGESEVHSRLGVPVIDGDPGSEVSLRAASISNASSVISTLETDEENALVCLAARGLNPAIRLILRGETERSVDLLNRIGADAVICPEVEAGRALAGAVLEQTPGES